MVSSKPNDELRFFAENTTFHGIAHVVNNKLHIGVRLAWVLVFLGMLGLYLYFACQSLINYYGYPVVTNVEYLTTDKLKFPSVTICNSNFARYSAVMQDEELRYLYRAPGFDPNYPVNEEEVDLRVTSRKAAHQPEDMYRECSFDGHYQTPCNVSQEIVWTIAPNGYCHTFHSQRMTDEMDPKITTRPGQDYGFTLLINIEQYDFLKSLTNSSGIQVVVHDQNTLPDIGEKGFLVSPGTETLVALSKTTVKRLPEPWAKKPDLCLDTNARDYKNPLEFFPYYSLSACQRECRIQHQIKSCNCSAHIYGGFDVPVCPYKQFIGCSRTAVQAFESDRSVAESCDCKPTCEENVFDVSLSSGAIPNDFVKESFVKSLNIPEITTENVEKNIIALKIFFGEMRYTMIEQQAQYSPTSLFGELGGQLGLCLGASFLTICELLQLVGTVCAGIVRHRPKAPRRIDVVA